MGHELEEDGDGGDGADGGGGRGASIPGEWGGDQGGGIQAPDGALGDRGVGSHPLLRRGADGAGGVRRAGGGAAGGERAWVGGREAEDRVGRKGDRDERAEGIRGARPARRQRRARVLCGGHEAGEHQDGGQVLARQGGRPAAVHGGLCARSWTAGPGQAAARCAGSAMVHGGQPARGVDGELGDDGGAGGDGAGGGGGQRARRR